MQGTLTPSHPLGPHPARRGVRPALIPVRNRGKFWAGGGSQGCPPPGSAQVYTRCCGSPPGAPRAWCWQRRGWVLAAPPSAKNQARAGLRSWKLKFFCPHHPNKSQRGHSPPCAPKPSRGGAGGGVLGGTQPLWAPRPPSCPCLISCCSSGLTRRGRGAAVGSLAVLGGFPVGRPGAQRWWW